MRPTNINFSNLTFKGLTKKILLYPSSKPKIIVTVNAEFIVRANQNPRFRRLINRNYSTFDGQWPYFLARLQNPKVEIEKISGSEFIYELCKTAKDSNGSIFLLGGTPEGNSKAQKVLAKKFNILVGGYCPPQMPYPFPTHINKLILSKVRRFNPSVLIVCFGAMKQEFWIEDHFPALKDSKIKWIMGGGGTLEIVSGLLPRAPYWVQRAGLEIFYRLLIQPKWFRIKRLFLSLQLFRYAFEK